MTTITGGPDGGGNNVKQAELQTIAAASATSHSATQLVLNLGGGQTLTIDGSGFSGFNANGIPNAGTITSLSASDGGVLDSTFSAFSIAFNTLWSFITNGDTTGFANALFGGNDSFVSHDASTLQDDGDSFIGENGNDAFNMTHAVAGAFANITGGGGIDTFKFGANFDAATDQIDGGTGADKLFLSGDYFTHGLAFGTSIVNVDEIELTAGNSYALTTSDSTVAAGTTLTVNGSTLGAGGTILVFDGSAETDGRFTLDGGTGNDIVTGGAGNDVFNMYLGGNDTVHGGAGEDKIVFRGTFTAQDSVDGGDAKDVLYLDGDYSTNVTFLATTLTNVEDILLSAGHSYNLTTNDANVAAGRSLTVNGATLGATDVLTFNGQAETNGKFVLIGGAANDVLTGGAINDKIEGGAGADLLNGGGGHDSFIYKSEQDSIGSANGEGAGSGFDTITNADFAFDKFDLFVTVAAVDTEVVGGLLRKPFFDTDLSAALTSSNFGAHSAILFAPSTGDFVGHLFLIVDTNGTAGYQSAGDLVIDVTGAGHVSHLSTATFI
jgi:Ca2+-binding RTX toxin-like protein